ncbi:MAG TPA: isocitrate lyase/phosphoenolpyruvate mutase family protein [Hanamia sp.]
MTNSKIQQAKALLLHELHHNGKMLVLPNIWDPLGAALLESLEYPAIATASASIAFTNGYIDGENMPFNEVVIQLNKIVKSVNIPVTADIESGYANSDAEFRKNIEMIINSGVVGINIEDTNKQSGALFPIEIQCQRIGLIRNISEAMGTSLFINARTDVYIKGNDFITDEEKFEETLKRGKAYMDAGADCIFPIVMKQKKDIQNLISNLQCPTNILALPGVPDLKILNEIGVARVSLGPGFLKIALQAMKKLALKLKSHEGMDKIVGNEITSDFIVNLMTKK